MSIKINKNNKEFPLGFVPQSLYDDVAELKEVPNLVKAEHNVGVFNVDSLNKQYGQFVVPFTIASSGTRVDVDYTSIIPRSLADYRNAWVSEGFLITDNGTLPINFYNNNLYISAWCEGGTLRVLSNQWTGDGYAIIKYLKN